jgi:polynucleotide 5'-hydroxyl-kinase GRC3/NOL9
MSAKRKLEFNAPISAFAAARAKLASRGLRRDDPLDYDSEEGMKIEDGESSADEIVPTEYSTWRETKDNLNVTERGQKVHLQHKQTLAILGQYTIKVNKGVVSISGGFLTPKSKIQKVVAPSTEPIPVLRCASADGAEVDLMSANEDEDFSRLLSPLFRGIWSCQCPICSETDAKFTFRKILDSKQLCQKHYLDIQEYPNSWLRLINRLDADLQSARKRRHLVVCGRNRTKRSLFSRYLTNKLLSDGSKSVTFLDFDSEFTLPGHIGRFQVSKLLTEPTFARDCKRYQQTNRWHRVNSISSPFSRAAIKDLFTSLPTDSTSVVIQCPDWFQGSGNQLVADIIAMSKATDIITLSEPPAQALQSIKELKPVPIYHDLTDSQTVSLAKTSRTHNELIDMNFMAYFHTNSERRYQLNVKPISHWRPYVVAFNDIAGVFIPSDISYSYPNMLSRMLNKSIVSVVLLDEKHSLLNIEIGEGDFIPFTRSSMPDPSKSQCIGVILIRSIDLDRKAFFILGSTGPASQFPSSRLVLVWGGSPAPSWADREDLEYTATKG